MTSTLTAEQNITRVRTLEAEAAQLRRTVPAFTRTVRVYTVTGDLEHVMPCTDEFAGSVLEMWSDQGCWIVPARGFLAGQARFLVDVPDGRIFTLA